MTKIMIFVFLISSNLFANIPIGKYKLEKIQCKKGYKLPLGHRTMRYDVFFEVSTDTLQMKANAT